MKNKLILSNLRDSNGNMQNLLFSSTKLNLIILFIILSFNFGHSQNNSENILTFKGKTISDVYTSGLVIGINPIIVYNKVFNKFTITYRDEDNILSQYIFKYIGKIKYDKSLDAWSYGGYYWNISFKPEGGKEIPLDKLQFQKKGIHYYVVITNIFNTEIGLESLYFTIDDVVLQ